MNQNTTIINQGKTALAILARIHPHGAYRIIRDPEGVISIWSIEGTARMTFRVSFADRGHLSNRIEDMSADFLRALVEYVKKITVRAG